MARNEQKVSVDGHQLKLTSLDKVYYPETGTTKGQVLDYYARMAPYVIRHARDRIATRKRWVNGVGTPEKPGKVFFEKDLPDGAPSWIPSRTIEHSTGKKIYPLVQDQATLTYLAQLGSLELHIPQWRVLPGSSDPGTITSETRYPDRMVFDLDPGEGRELADCVEVAHLVRELLNGMGLEVYPLTSGSKGIHLYAPLDGSATSQQVSDVAHELARSLEADHPKLVVSAMKKALRKNKVFIDWSQNSASKTTVAPYSLRGRFTPTVATPRTWDELADPAKVEHLRFEEVLERVEDLGDLLEPLAQEAGADDAGRVDDADPDKAPEDRLTTYRSMRDPDKTPEPVPDSHGDSGDELIFVIQEHHARRLHWDFRLEHNGVLVSWALPKGPPTDPKKNHLAIQTEDHPVEYATFEGIIPKEEYGGGEVTIWDSGTYELKKWRDGKEITALLHGQPDGGLGGSKEFALFNTGDHGPNDDPARNWMIHVKEPSADDGSTEDPERAEATQQESETTKDEDSGDQPRKADPAKHTPMLATIGKLDTVRNHKADWAFEMKWDGVRAIATVEAATDDSPGAVTLMSRNELEMTDTYPELAELANCVTSDCVLDGEIVAFGNGGNPEFGRLQRRIKLTKSKDIEKERANTPVYFMVFDILSVDGESLLRESYEQRRQRLFEVVSENDHIYVPEAFDGSLDDAMHASQKLKLEGVMAKQKSSVYLPGKRTRTWLKLKHSTTREVLIIGWREGKGGRQQTFGSLLVAAYDDDGELTYMGRVGTGFDSHQLRSIKEELDKIPRKTAPAEVPSDQRHDAHWVTPKLVADVEYGGITDAGRLRHPVWRGLRDDIDPEDVTV
jgi:bifunctional non-homologous end joining protein LigD